MVSVFHSTFEEDATVPTDVVDTFSGGSVDLDRHAADIVPVGLDLVVYQGGLGHKCLTALGALVLPGAGGGGYHGTLGRALGTVRQRV